MFSLHKQHNGHLKSSDPKYFFTVSRTKWKELLEKILKKYTELQSPTYPTFFRLSHWQETCNILFLALALWIQVTGPDQHWSLTQWPGQQKIHVQQFWVGHCEIWADSEPIPMTRFRFLTIPIPIILTKKSFV